MKSLRSLLALLLCLTSAASFAQSPQSRVFSKFPDVIKCSASQFSNAFTAAEGETITLSFSDNFIITGKVISNVQKYWNLQSMTMRLPGFADAVLHLSKQINEDKSISYVGRIMSTEAADGFELKKDEANNYQLNKIETNMIRQLCSQ